MIDRNLLLRIAAQMIRALGMLAADLQVLTRAKMPFGNAEFAALAAQTELEPDPDGPPPIGG